MSNMLLYLASLSIDEHGRVVVPDEIAASISRGRIEINLASGPQMQGTNYGCTNTGGYCGGTVNDWCSNISNCLGATNIRFCDNGPI